MEYLYCTPPGMINAAAHVAALLPPVRVAERAPRVLAGTPNFYASTVGATSLLYPLGTNYTRRYTCPFRRHLSPWRYVHTRTSHLQFALLAQPGHLYSISLRVVSLTDTGRYPFSHTPLFSECATSSGR